MIRSKLSSKVMLLVGGIGLSIAAFAGSQPAAAQSYSNEYACPVGTMYDPTYGCTTESTDDFGYYGYPGFAGRGNLPIRCPMIRIAVLD